MLLELALSPSGHLFIEQVPDGELQLSQSAAERLRGAFSFSSAVGLEVLAGEMLEIPLPSSFSFWREFARKYFAGLCQLQQTTEPISVFKPSQQDLSVLAEEAPPMKGMEYLNGDVLARLWDELEQHVRGQIVKVPGGPPAYLRSRNPLWHTVGRVTFHLAENKRNPAAPFAFLATYTHRLSDQGKPQHLPLGRALQEYAGVQNRNALAALLSPVQCAAQKSKLARELLESRQIFHPQAWSPSQAYRFLKEIPMFEESGLVVRIPDWWKAGRPPRPQVNVRIGERSPNVLGKDSLLDFQVNATLEGQPLTEQEWKTILSATDGLVLLKGKWVEVDRNKLAEVLDHWKRVKAETGGEGISLLQGMRLLAGFTPESSTNADTEETRTHWTGITAGAWIESVLQELQSPQASALSDPGPALQAQLRPYQRQGAHWLWFMNRLGLGACLADDMGLGKTIQVISLLLALKRQPTNPACPSTSLLVVPASLIANWKSEIQKFAPSLKVLFAHPSETPVASVSSLVEDPAKKLGQYDLVITSYSLLLRLPWLKDTRWNLLILDEAQAIKNPGARQTKAAKELQGHCRIALSGTPIENRLGDLWSLFDFICPGLLGNAREFAAFIKNREGQQKFAPLRRLVRPYILRRLKTDRRIIADLPEKTEIDTFCPLSRPQAILYQQAVKELAEKLEAPEMEGIQRRGIILAYLTRFKQICNHPSQWLGDGIYKPDASGKFSRLRELSEEIASKQEKLLIFSQYREINEPLARFLRGVFGQNGLTLHGGTPVAQRKKLVDQFQNENGPPFFVLSLKAGGTGLNLTAASHVIHFDRWWNPAVENQATDRAFRIGQKRNVMVHKFICRGTLEERIHELISSKTALAEDVLGEGGERLLTEMNNSELLRFVALDINAATEE